MKVGFHLTVSSGKQTTGFKRYEQRKATKCSQHSQKFRLLTGLLSGHTYKCGGCRYSRVKIWNEISVILFPQGDELQKFPQLLHETQL
jgi:predicted SprT family Zn-dependent metalloprotease